MAILELLQTLFQSEDKYKAIDMKMIFYFSCKWNLFSKEKFCTWPRFQSESEELKQQRRRRLQKRHLQSKFALPQTLSRLLYSISMNSSNNGKIFWSWILKECIKVQEKKLELGKGLFWVLLIH